MVNDKQNDKQIADTLNECFESMFFGNDSVESCLAHFPEHTPELEPLLEIMKAARAASNLSPDPSFRARARYELRSALYDSMPAKKRPALSWRWRWATLASTAGVLLLTSTGGAVAASSNSMPGQPLYQVKRIIEEVQLTLTPSQAAKARLYATLADRRVGELVQVAQMENLTAERRVQITEDLTQQFTNDLSMVSAIVAPSRALTFGGGSKQSGTPSVNDSSPEQSATVNSTVPAPYITSPLAPSVLTITPAPAEVTVTQAAPMPTPTFVLSQPTITLSGITDPALLKLLQQYSVKNIAQLMAILDNVPPSVKTALLAAIQAATFGYGQILGA
jgi:hypothetical protein